MTPNDCPIVPEKDSETEEAKEWLRGQLKVRNISSEMQIMHLSLFESMAKGALGRDRSLSAQRLAKKYLKEKMSQS